MGSKGISLVKEKFQLFWALILKQELRYFSCNNDLVGNVNTVIISHILLMQNSTRNSLNENARFTFSAAESASTSGQDEPSSNVESQSHRPSSPLSGGLPPLGRKGGLSPINQSFVGSLQNFSLTSATANHLTDADSSAKQNFTSLAVHLMDLDYVLSAASLDIGGNLNASLLVAFAGTSGTSRENGYLPASEKQDHEWKYDDEGYSEEAHSEDVLRAANTLENIHSKRKSHSLTSSWRRSTQMSLDDDTSDGLVLIPVNLSMLLRIKDAFLNIEELIEEEVPSERESS
eukprot:Gb_16646 [translate_table: standard]